MAASGNRERLDNLLVARGLIATRSRARDLIKRGKVSVDGNIITKPAQMTVNNAELQVLGRAGDYVSRGALKLDHALEHFGFDPKGCNCLDVGASTGGFTQVLLERGAAHVTAVDVGQGQFSTQLGKDPKISVLEGIDARDLSRDHVTEPVSAIVADVSFISLTKALPAALDLAAPNCWAVVLIKPQFEVGPGRVGKGGVVRDESVRTRAVDDVKDWLNAREGWDVVDVIPSPITGGDGNTEFLMGAVKRS